jgi:hypothetical protein
LEKTSSPEATLSGAAVAPAQNQEPESARVGAALAEAAWAVAVADDWPVPVWLSATPATTAAANTARTGQRRTSANGLLLPDRRPVDLRYFSTGST